MKSSLDPVQMIFLVLGIMGAITFGDDLVPALRSIQPDMLAAGIKGGAGVAVGLVAGKIYKRIRNKPPE